jgi:hypothetical protein
LERCAATKFKACCRLRGSCDELVPERLLNATWIGLDDLAKLVFQVHGLDRDEWVVLKRQLKRSQVIPFFA